MSKMKQDYSILIGGEAGQGSMMAGQIIAKLFSELGYNIFIYNDYQSLIRGGHNFSQIRASKEKILTHREKSDFILALDKNTFEKHKGNLNKGGIIIYDSGSFSLKDKKAIGISLNKIVSGLGGIPIMNNVALVGGFAKIIGIEWGTVRKVLSRKFKKYQEINLKVAKVAYNQTENLIKVRKLSEKSQPLLTGNEALALGTVKAGLSLYIAYPMTPSTGILHYLVNHQKDLGISVSHLENELGVINAAVGSAYTGARTMVGSSGGGFALMTEALSLAVQNETPLVIVESQRMAPGSGVPTYTAQSDLLFALSAGHGDIVKFVIAPGDAEEACFWGGKIMNLSWKYQTPSIILIDKEVSESVFSFDKRILDKIDYEKPLLWNKKGKYLRYKDAKNGISPLAFPGDKNAVIKANSYEHDQFGLTIEDEKNVKKMQDKRLRKFKEMKREVDKLEAVKIYGKKRARKAVIAWGSTKGAVKEVAEKLGFKMIQLVILQPFPEKQLKEALKGVSRIVLVENNSTAQLKSVLSKFGVKPDKEVLKYDGRPFVPEEIEKQLKNF